MGLSLVACRLAAQPFRVGAEVELVKSDLPKARFTGMIGWSKSAGTTEWENLMVDAEYAYSLKKNVSLLGGAGAYRTWETEDADLFELRPWQGIALQFPEWKRIYFGHRLLVEQRWQQEKKEWQFSPRVRYRVSTRLDITNADHWLQSFYLFLSSEWLNNFNKPLAERFSSNQTYSFAIGFSPSKSSVLEFAYDIDATDNLRLETIDVDVHVITVSWVQNW